MFKMFQIIPDPDPVVVKMSILMSVPKAEISMPIQNHETFNFNLEIWDSSFDAKQLLETHEKPRVL